MNSVLQVNYTNLLLFFYCSTFIRKKEGRKKKPRI